MTLRESPALERLLDIFQKSNIKCLVIEPNLKELPNELSRCLKTNLK